jgi:hypothetical protein
METCNLSDFMKAIEPWLSSDYLHKAYKDEKGQVILLFKDGVRNVYRIDDCNAAQLDAVFQDLKKKGITIED